MERTAKPQRALLSADREFSHTITAHIVSMDAQGAIMACYMKVPVGQEVFVRVGNAAEPKTAVVIRSENVREVLAASPSAQTARAQGFAVKFVPATKLH